MCIYQYFPWLHDWIKHGELNMSLVLSSLLLSVLALSLAATAGTIPNFVLTIIYD